MFNDQFTVKGENFEVYEKFCESRAYVWDRIQKNIYPAGHPFHEIKENDFLILILSILKYYLKETDILDDYLERKLVAEQNGKYSAELFFQGLNEITFFYFIFIGCFKNGIAEKIYQIHYENYSLYNSSKKLEYSFLFKDNTAVCIEVKTLTCDPFIREDITNLKKQLYIKPYFHNVDLNNIPDIENYCVLEKSSHDRQLRKNIKKIVEKFTGDSLETDFGIINIGVLVVQFATSIEEFFSYLLHPENGIVYQQDFAHLDCLVLFSMTARPDIDMQDIYETGHVVAVLLNDCEYIREYLSKLRLDNFIAVKRGNDVYVPEEILQLSKREYGMFRLVVRDGYAFYAPIERTEKDIDNYLEYLKGQRSYPNEM